LRERRENAARVAFKEGARRSNTGAKEGARRSNTLFWQHKRVLGGATYRETGYLEEQPTAKQGTWRSRFLQNRVPGGAAHNITSKTGYLEEQPHGKTGYLEE